MDSYLPDPQLEKRKQEQGQTFVEFILLMIIVIGLSFAFFTGMKRGVANRWQTLVSIIASPNVETLNNRPQF